MNPFEFHNPVRIVFGPGEVARVGALAAKEGTRALIVSYADVSCLGGLIDRIHAALAAAGLAYADHFAATPNPLLSQAEAGVARGRAFGADLVIGVGGGSAMDLAKIVAAGLRYPHPLARMIRFSHADDAQIPPTEALPTLMVPTLPATASEMNPTAVVTDDATLRKSYVWAPDCLYPRVAILDPTLTLSLPPFQTACGAIDAISHVVEPFVFSDAATYGNTDLQDQLQLGVIRALLANLPKVLADPGDVQLRGLMQFGATVGLNGWLTCGVQGWTPMHQMGHVLSSHFRATHGATLACMMLAWMRFFADDPRNARFRRLAREIWGTDDLTAAADRFEDYIARQGVPTRIAAFGCSEKDLDALTQGVVDVSFGPDGRLASIPPVTREEVRAIYARAL